MRRGPEVSGWVGSLFPEPIDQVKVPSDRCICHQDCPQYETCETEALDKSSKVYYLLRCVKGKFPACANCMCMACDRYHECEDGPERGQPGGTRYRMCNRPISITGCLDYSGSVPWRSEAACKKCDHICDLRKELIWAPRVRCDLNPIEAVKKPTEEPSAVQLDGKPTVEHPTLIRYGHETWRRYELEGRLVEEFVSTDRPVRKESEFAADMIAVDAARKAAGDLPLARSFIEKGARGIRVYEDPAKQSATDALIAVIEEQKHRVPRLECTHKLASQGNGGLCSGCSERKGEPCKYSRAIEAEPTVEAPAAPTKKPVKAKKQPKPVGILRCDECLCLTCPHKDLCHSCKDKELCASHSLCTVECPGVTWDCSDCICPHCANNGASCRDCKGRVYCSKHVGEICPDFRAPESPKPLKEKPTKAKKQPKAPKHGENYCVLRGGDCSVHNGCQNGDVPCTLKDVPHLKEIHLPCEIHALLDLAVKPAKEPMALLLNGKWYSDGKMLWDCSDCLCLACANEGKSCHDCKGFERCLKIGGTGGKIGACPDFRTEEGKEQHCLENGCLCFKCQFIGERFEDCPGPIRCSKPTMKCKEYVGGDMEDIGDDTEDPYTPEHPYPGDGKVPDLIDVLEGKT